jgi:transforming growth factor-beta-induced protein
MKKIGKPVLSWSLALIVLFVTAIRCSDDKNTTPAPTQNIVALASANSDLSSLVAALGKFPDLVSTLSGPGNFTVFAPSNQAFTTLLAAIGQTDINNVPDDVLKSILQYHVVSTAALKSTQLTAGNVNTVANENIAVTLNPIKLNGTVNVTTPDVLASNGVVHIVDAVLVNSTTIAPIVGTIYAPAYFNKDFSTLVAAVKGASQSTRDLLLSATKKTLFAPNNAAFTAAGITSLPTTAAAIDAILAYHVLNSEVRAAGLPNVAAPGNSEITAVGGKFYLSNRGSAGVFINGRTQITQTDISASNGVVHLINRTLVPPSQTIAQIATALSTGSPAQFTQLVAALTRIPALLNAASGTSSNLTVFAPTDAAFQTLYTDLGVTGLSGINDATLTAVLQHHIISAPTTATGRVFSRDLVTGNVATLNGNISINATAGTVTGSLAASRVANISTDANLVNVLGNNGVIHTISQVLRPN